MITTPTTSGGSFTSYSVGPSSKLIVVSQQTWDRKGRIRHVDGSSHKVKSRTRTAVGPCYRVEGEVHGDSWAIDKVTQGLGHFKVCMKAGDHTKIADTGTGASSSHRESWLWGFESVDVTKGEGTSTTWCLDPGEQGPCLPVEYRYWRYTFHWKQGVSIFAQDVAHHKTLYIGCTLRADPGGYQCGTGEA
jgi:hypothetical protein